MSVNPDVFVVGKLINVSTVAIPPPIPSMPEYGSVEVALCGYGPMTPRVEGEALIARVTQGYAVLQPPAGNVGQFELVLYSNGLIEPSGTYYTITTRDSNGDIVQVEAYYFEPGSWDLSNMQPFDPGQPAPPLPPLIIPQLLVVPYSSTPVFDGTNFTSFMMTLTGNVSLATIQNMIPGNLYTFIILQDATGGRAFGWPVNAYNPTPINLLPSGYTVQTFVALDGGALYSIGAGSWYTL
jgi:hypothetical protein